MYSHTQLASQDSHYDESQLRFGVKWCRYPTKIRGKYFWTNWDCRLDHGEKRVETVLFSVNILSWVLDPISDRGIRKSGS